MIKFVSNLRQAGSFFSAPPVSSTNKTDRHDMTEILLKVALNTIKQKQKKLPSEKIPYRETSGHHSFLVDLPVI